jgi:hypothetical protein
LFQEWIRIKCFPKFGGNVDEILVDEDEDDPLADDVIIPVSLCNVVMED